MSNVRRILAFLADVAGWTVARVLILVRAWRIVSGIVAVCIAVAIITSWPWGLLALGCFLIVHDQFNPATPKPRPLTRTERLARRDGRV